MKKNTLIFGFLLLCVLNMFTSTLHAKNPEIVPSVPQQYLYEDSLLFFEVKDINSNRLRWEFGDGNTFTGSKKADHIFKMRGNYTIRVTDLEGKYKDPIILQIRVVKDDREIGLTGEMFFPGIPVQMKARGFADLAVLWDFGDGTVQNMSRNVSHTYNRTGIFTVKAIDLGGKDVKEITKKITINNDARIIVIPKEIIAGETTEFYIKNSQGGNYTWTFSDGQREQGTSINNIIFKQPGTIKITVSDSSGKYPVLSEQAVVIRDIRQLQSSTSFALPDEIIRFDAVNFKGSSISWDFGDGTIINGSKKETHKYKENGSYAVTARDFSGKSPNTFTTNIIVNELSPDFQLTALEITFENGKAYQVAPLKNLSPSYIVKMKARGRGLLRGKWMLDNQTIGLFQVLLYPNKLAQLKSSQVATLPMKDTGLHELTLEFSNYSFQQQIPVIRYFITEADAIKIVYPEPDSKISVDPSKPLILNWECSDPLVKNKKEIIYQLAISETPLQFLGDERTIWKETGTQSQYTLDVKQLEQRGQSWIYWQIRALKPNGSVLTISDISAFKLLR